jgi:hypothetical protein
MKTSVYVRALAVASVALAPLASFAQDQDQDQAQMCADAFVAQNFPGQSPTISLDRELTRRASSSDSVRMRLSAANRRTGVVLASATCVAKRGVVKLYPVSLGAWEIR